MQPLLTAERSSATEVSTEEERARRAEERVAQQPQREPPFTSLAAEVRQFLRTALPLSVASAFKYAAPPTFTMAIAGHIDVASALLQEALDMPSCTIRLPLPCRSCRARLTFAASSLAALELAELTGCRATSTDHC